MIAGFFLFFNVFICFYYFVFSEYVSKKLSKIAYLESKFTNEFTNRQLFHALIDDGFKEGVHLLVGFCTLIGEGVSINPLAGVV